MDAKTPFSFLVGTVAGLSGLNPSWATVVVIGFEAALVALDEGLPSTFGPKSPQSYSNQIVDTLVGIAGVYYGEWLHKKNARRAGVNAAQTTATAVAPNMQNLISASNPPVAGWYR